MAHAASDPQPTAPPEKPLNICIVSAKFPLANTAGEISFLWPVARGLVKRGHSVTVLSWRNKNRLQMVEKDGVQALYLGEFAGAVFDNLPQMILKKFMQLHREKPFHLIHSLDTSGLQIGLQRKKLGVAVVYDVDATHLSNIYSIFGMSQETLRSLIKTSVTIGYDFLRTYWKYDRRLLKTADAVFVHSLQQRMILERYYLYPDQRIFTVPFGIAVEDLSPREKSEELMKKIGLPLNSHTVVTVTDMTELGEMRHLLWAFEKVAVKKPTARLIIVGHGPLKKEIEFEALNLALGGRVIFVGDVPTTQLSDYIALADVFVNLSARSSGIEQSLLEAMAQRKIIVGSEVSPLSNVVEDGVDGFLIRPADTYTLAELLMQVFNGQISSAVIGEKARQKVLSMFDSQKMLEQTLMAYRKARHRFATAHRPLFSLASPEGSQ
jgi:glycosyltransferase involved in cell wall biosynthesis